jgi:hypothetical protein
MTLQLDPNGPDLDPDGAKAGDVISDSCWNGQWTSSSPEDDAAAQTQANLGDIARKLRNARGNRSQG